MEIIATIILLLTFIVVAYAMIGISTALNRIARTMLEHMNIDKEYARSQEKSMASMCDNIASLYRKRGEPNDTIVN